VKGAAALVAAVAVAAPGAAAEPHSVRSTAPQAVGFGEAFTYVVEVTVPADETGTALLTAGSVPFAVLESSPVESDRRGDVTVLRLVMRLACLAEGCLGADSSRRVRLPAPRVVTESRTEVGARPAVVVRGRVPASAVAAGPSAYRRDATLPEAAGRTYLSDLALLLAAVAAAALLAALSLAVLPLVSRRGLRDPDPLARAIRLVRESADRPTSDRRRAVDLLARAVRARDSESLASDATRVAWAPPGPTPEDARRLASRAAGERG
jgi:hypothetical protein